MAKSKKPAMEDPEQSRRFIETVAELEAAGELSRIGADESFRRTFERLIKPMPKESRKPKR